MYIGTLLYVYCILCVNKRNQIKHLSLVNSVSFEEEEEQETLSLNHLNEIERKVQMIKTVSDSLVEADDLIEEIKAENKNYKELNKELKREIKSLEGRNENYQILVQNMKTYQQRREKEAEKKLKDMEQKMITLSNEKMEIVHQNEKLRAEYKAMKTEMDKQVQETMASAAPVMQSKADMQSIHIQFAKTNTVAHGSTMSIFGKMERDDDEYDTSPLHSPRDAVYILSEYEDTDVTDHNSQPMSVNQFEHTFRSNSADPASLHDTIWKLNETIKAKDREIAQLQETETNIMEQHKIEIQGMRDEIVKYKQKLMKAQQGEMKSGDTQNGRNHRHGNPNNEIDVSKCKVMGWTLF